MLKNLILRKFLQQEKYLDQFYNSIIKLREVKSRRRRRLTPAPAVYSDCTPSVHVGVVRIDQCSPGCRRGSSLSLILTDTSDLVTPILRCKSSDNWTSVSEKYSLLSGWTTAAKFRTILGAKYQMRLQIVKMIFSQILITLSQCISRTKNYIFCLWVVLYFKWNLLF